MGSSVNARVAVNAAEGIYYKEFLPRGPLEWFKSQVRGSRATRARQQSDRLRKAGFTAPYSLAWGRLPRHREYLFSNAVPGKGVTTWLREELSDRSGEALAQRRRLLACLGEFVGRLHAAGFVHGDLRTSNVLAEPTEAGFDFALIDNERNSRRQPAAGRDILRNLMQLNMLLPTDVTRTDRMRCFLRWRKQQADLTDAEAKLLALESWRWAMRRLAKKGLA